MPVWSIKDKIQRQLPLLKERYSIGSLWVFGSYVREDRLPESDSDLLVSFENPPGLLKLIEIDDKTVFTAILHTFGFRFYFVPATDAW